MNAQNQQFDHDIIAQVWKDNGFASHPVVQAGLVTPYTILAMDEQESMYGQYKARPEFRIYEDDTEPMDLATTSEILLACSYGRLQTLGISLDQMGFFQSWFQSRSPEDQIRLDNPYSQLTICQSLDDYLTKTVAQIEWGIRYLLDYKHPAVLAKMKAHPELNIVDNQFWLLRAWNGDWSGKNHYAETVQPKISRIRTEVKF